MRLNLTLLTLSAASFALAAPFSSFPILATQSDPLPKAVWKIHESCNGTQRAQIQRGIFDMHRLASSSIDHILNSPSSELFSKYFGAQADPAPVIGYYSQLLHGGQGALLRCDDPDGNCQFPDWAGHWRGSNASSETVICDHSYSRRPLEQLCAFGFNLSTDNPSLYFGADLMHRAFHVPNFVIGKVEHYADSYGDCLELAKEEDGRAVSNQGRLQYFALDVYSRTMTKWGCVGEKETASESAAPSQEATSSVSADCHTHADGSVHCGSH